MGKKVPIRAYEGKSGPEITHDLKERGGGSMARGCEVWVEMGIQMGIPIGREEGIEEGREQGQAEGREEGIEEGREQGQAEGREEGFVVGAVVSLGSLVGVYIVKEFVIPYVKEVVIPKAVDMAPVVRRKLADGVTTFKEAIAQKRAGNTKIMSSRNGEIPLHCEGSKEDETRKEVQS